MNILVIGGGGREHALVWKLRQSSLVEKIWCAPGNGGVAQHGECIVADAGDVRGLADLAVKLGADLTVIGPEQPLVLGVADEFERRGLRLVGPSRSAAQLEGSKIFAKDFLRRHRIPTARTLGAYDSARDATIAARSLEGAIVLKADGLCGGKGVLVTASREEAASFVERVMEQREFGDGGARLLMEEALEGRELSFIILTDGTNFIPMAPTRDHKRVFDGDLGPNTGGMGAFSSDEIVPLELYRMIVESVVRPTLAGLKHDGLLYRGFLYFGLMLTAEGPKVLEFNCRMGDPETQPVVVRMDFDLAETLLAVTEGKLAQREPVWKKGASLCVVMASGGYPGKFEVGRQIGGLCEAGAVREVTVFHAGTRTEGNKYYTCSGRVLGVTATGDTLTAARQTAYEAVGKIRFDGAHYRRDIGSTGGTQAAKAEHGGRG